MSPPNVSRTLLLFFFLMIRRPPRSTPLYSSAASDVYKRQERLVASGHAYVASEGDVYFDVRSYPEYGSLTNQRLEDMVPAPDGAPADDDGDLVAKHDPRDFALWKSAKPG